MGEKLYIFLLSDQIMMTVILKRFTFHLFYNLVNIAFILLYNLVKVFYVLAQCPDKNEGNLKAIFQSYPVDIPYHCFTDNGHKLCV